MEKKWFVKDYEDGDKEKIFLLRKEVYGEPFDSYEWDWKFKNSKILVAINDAGEAVAIRPTVFMKLKFHDQIINAGMNVDVMTHPQFQRMGIFSTLVKKSYQKLKDLNIKVVYTFPNELSFPGYVKSIKWVKVSSIPLLVKPIRTKNLLAQYIKNSTLCSILSPFVNLGFSIIFHSRTIESSNLSIKKIERFNSDFDSLWKEVSSRFNISVVRDSEFLNWRYVDRPGYHYEIFSAYEDEKLVGYVVNRIDEIFGVNLGIITDIIATKDDAARFLIQKACEDLQKSPIDVIGCLMLENYSYYQNLKELGFRKIPKRYSPKQFHFVAKIDEEILSAEDYMEKNWFITFGDIDIA